LFILATFSLTPISLNPHFLCKLILPVFSFLNQKQKEKIAMSIKIEPQAVPQDDIRIQKFLD